MTMAKALTNAAQPMGAVAVSERIHDTIFAAAPEDAIEFFHGYTYSGHPAACAAGLATLDIYRERGTVRARARAVAVLPRRHLLAQGRRRCSPTFAATGCWRPSNCSPTAHPAARGHVFQKKLFDNGLNLKTTGDSAIVAPPLIAEQGARRHDRRDPARHAGQASSARRADPGGRLPGRQRCCGPGGRAFHRRRAFCRGWVDNDIAALPRSGAWPSARTSRSWSKRPGCSRRCRRPSSIRATGNRCSWRCPARSPATSRPTLVGPETRIRDLAGKLGLDISRLSIVDTARRAARGRDPRGRTGARRQGFGADQGQPRQRGPAGAGRRARFRACAPIAGSRMRSSSTCRACRAACCWPTRSSTSRPTWPPSATSC